MERLSVKGNLLGGIAVIKIVLGQLLFFLFYIIWILTVWMNDKYRFQ